MIFSPSGWDIETGGHVFQRVFTNSQSIVPTRFLTLDDGYLAEGGYLFRVQYLPEFQPE